MVWIRRVAMSLSLIIGLVLILAGAWRQAGAATLDLREANAVITVQGVATEQSATLPYHWDRLHAGLSGYATFEVAFTLPEPPSTPYGLYLPRVGNAYEIWLNGMLLQRGGDLQRFDGADFAKVPRYVVIPVGYLRIANSFRIHIRTDVGRRGGLAPLLLGPEAEIYPLFEQDYFWRSTGSLVVVTLSLLVSLTALFLWVTQIDPDQKLRPQRDRLYLLVAVAEVCWAIRVGDTLLENPWIAWPGWGMLGVVSMAGWIYAMALFCLEVARLRQIPAAALLHRWLLFLLVSSPLAATASLVFGYPQTLTFWYFNLALTFLVFLPVFFSQLRRHPTQEYKLVAATIFINTLVGLRDWYVYRLSEAYGQNTWMRFSSVLFGVTLCYIVLRRFNAATAQARELARNLAARVADKEQELAQSYQHLEKLVREQERTGERTRILRDLHDGVGSHISTAIRQLESAPAAPLQVLQTLRDALDHLKLTIDSMNLPLGDVNAMLASLRYRLEPRLKAANIELQWNVELLEPLSKLDQVNMRHLQFMVFEALSNVMQHAKASLVRIELCQGAGGGAILSVIDNGCGFDHLQVNLTRESSLQQRANILGAGLNIYSVPGHTEVEIKLCAE